VDFCGLLIFEIFKVKILKGAIDNHRQRKNPKIAIFPKT